MWHFDAIFLQRFVLFAVQENRTKSISQKQ